MKFNDSVKLSQFMYNCDGIVNCVGFNLKMYQTWEEYTEDHCCPIELILQPGCLTWEKRVKGVISLLKNSRLIVASEFSLKTTHNGTFLPLKIKSYLFKSRNSAERFSIDLHFDDVDIDISPPQLPPRSTEYSVVSSQIHHIQEASVPPKYSMLNKMSADLLKLLENKTSTDINLKCDTETISAHKIILSARSPVFEAMLSSEFQEKNTGIVEIKDISSRAMHSVLRYIYGDSTPELSFELACEVLFASDKYQLQELKNACTEFLKSSVSSETVLQILKLANLCDDHLKMFAMNFVCKNFRKMKKTTEWMDMEKTDPSLMIELMSFILGSL